LAGLEGLVEGLRSLSWSRGRGVPLLGCRRGGLGCWPLRGDYWLAGRFERGLVSQLFHRVYGVRLPAAERLVVFHRVPAPLGEYAVEVFMDGLRLGVVEYAPGRGWVYHPSGASASLAASLGAEPVRVEAARGRRLKGKRVRVPASQAAGGWVLVEAGGWLGPARLVAEGVAKVKDLSPRGARLLPPATLDEAVEANAELVGGLAAEAREFIRRVYARRRNPDGRLYVAFSGGADSTAVLSLAREAVGPERVVAVYADTGMEFPEARRHAERIASMLEVELEVVEPQVDPLEEVARRGLMSRDDRWCTRLLKLEPLRRFYRSRGVKLVLDGARMWESSNRARTPRLGENPLLPGVARALPIRHWSRLAVQLYLAERSIPTLHLYQEGLTRIGCIACPAMHLYELHIAYRLHPSWFHRLARAAYHSSGPEALARLLRGGWRRGGDPETWLPSGEGEG